jgi:trehalose synthase
MIHVVDVPPGVSLDESEMHATLARPVQDLRAEARQLVPALGGRRVWMVSSTARGGGVAEMLPRLITVLRELGVAVEWAVIGSDEPRFFTLTKHLHNLIHGVGEPHFDAGDRNLYDAVSRTNAASLVPHLAPGDMVVVHDPQPMGVGAILAREQNVPAIWRCHIGLDDENAATRAAWGFLAPYTDAYDHAVFTAPEYVTGFPAHRAAIIHPAIDPLSDKNRVLSTVRQAGVLVNAGLVPGDPPVLTPPYADRVERLAADGSWRLAAEDDLGILFRPLVTQISRWDRLKGFAPLLAAFALLKAGRGERGDVDPLHRRRLDLVRLVLAGPDPASIPDDPEAHGVLAEMTALYLELPAEVQRDVALLSLPMSSARENALIVNALQRTSSVVVQNSLREGFGLTVAEAMWKRAAVLGSAACGIRQQIRAGIDGCLVREPGDAEAVAATLDEMLADPARRTLWGRNAERRVVDNFLVFNQAACWLRLFERVVEERSARPAGPPPAGR